MITYTGTVKDVFQEENNGHLKKVLELAINEFEQVYVQFNYTKMKLLNEIEVNDAVEVVVFQNGKRTPRRFYNNLDAVRITKL